MDPTSACNMRCKGCWAAEYGHKQNLTFEEMDRVLTEAKALIREYLHRVADDHGVVPHIRFGHELQGAAWDDDAKRWRLQTSQGAMSADVLVTALGGLSRLERVVLHGDQVVRDVVEAGLTGGHRYLLRGIGSDPQSATQRRRGPLRPVDADAPVRTRRTRRR